MTVSVGENGRDTDTGLSWFSIVRLGLVQAALGAIVVLTTSTLNRVMVVELQLAAMVPGLLVGLHYAVQLSRPLVGHGADRLRHCTPWIVAGMAVLALAATGAAASVLVIADSTAFGLALAAVAFFFIGLGVGMAGTTLLTLIARTVSPARRAASATITWVLMIFGIIVSAATAGANLDPYTPLRLVGVATGISGGAFLLTLLAVWRIERSNAAHTAASSADRQPAFKDVVRETWADPTARAFTVFVFISMLAYSAQDLILEPYAGLVFGLSVGESTSLAAIQHQGVLVGMLLVGGLGSLAAVRRVMPLVRWTLMGCVLSAIGLGLVAFGGFAGPGWPIEACVLFLGFGNGVFAVGAIGSMFALAGAGKGGREGTRIGFWGASQAVAFALGGVVGTVGVDAMRAAGAGPLSAYATIFAAEAFLFLVSAVLAARIAAREPKAGGTRALASTPAFGRGLLSMEGHSHG